MRKSPGILPRRVSEGVTVQVHGAGLTVVARKATSLDGFGKTLQVVDHGNQNVDHDAGVQVVEYLGPELGILGLLDSDSQHALVPPGNTPSVRHTASLRMTESSRMFTRSTSENITGCIGWRGRLYRAANAASTSSVTMLMNSGDTSAAYISARNLFISRAVILRAYIVTIF